MVRQADYIYGVVPERGEYGFESKPADDDPAVLSRMQSIASSFQWSATAINDAQAIAVDRNHPPLVVRIVTDPRDPDGRRSLCMHIWITSETEPVSSMIAELWPHRVALPISQDEFLLSAARETSGRIVVGPNDSFTAVGFDQSWGTRATAHHPATRSASRSPARANGSTSARNLNDRKRSPLMLKALITLTAIALLATAGFAVAQYWEVERLQLKVNELAHDTENVAKASELIEQQLKEAENANHKKTIEIETRTRELVQLRTEAQRMKNRIAELDSVVAANPQKVDQAELLALRSFKAAVEKHIDSQSRSLKELADAVPKPVSKIEELTDKVKEAIQGRIDNE